MVQTQSLQGIRDAYQSTLPHVQKKLLAFPWENRDKYLQWLAHTHAYVVHTTRLVALAAAHAQGQYEHLHHPLLHHAGEEGGHDKMLLNDLAAMGAPHLAPHNASLTLAFGQSLYYQISYESPYALFGRAVPLEGAAGSVGPEVYARAKSAHGEAATTFLQTHAENDPHHVEEAFGILKDIPARDAEIVSRGIHQTADLFIAILDLCER